MLIQTDISSCSVRRSLRPCFPFIICHGLILLNLKREKEIRPSVTPNYSQKHGELSAMFNFAYDGLRSKRYPKRPDDLLASFLFLSEQIVNFFFFNSVISEAITMHHQTLILKSITCVCVCDTLRSSSTHLLCTPARSFSVDRY